MDGHPKIKGLLYDVFDEQYGLDVVISIHQTDGVRRLTLTGQQVASTLTPEIESRILNWLDNLAAQPVIQHEN